MILQKMMNQINIIEIQNNKIKSIKSFLALKIKVISHGLLYRTLYKTGARNDFIDFIDLIKTYKDNNHIIFKCFVLSANYIPISASKKSVISVSIKNLIYIMKRIKELIKKIRKSLHNVLDLDSYRELCLELSMLENLIDSEKKRSYKDGVFDCKRLVENRLQILSLS